MSLKCCVISLATSDQRFPEGMERLRESMKKTGFRGEFHCWLPGEFPEGCPSHQDVPFAFKPRCFREAGARGMDLVMWLDASCVVVRRLNPLFRMMASDGYVLFRNQRYMVGEWASDEAIEVLGLSREQALQIPEVNAAAIGLNLRNPTAAVFLDQWHEAARGEVAFRGARASFRSPGDYNDMKWNRAGKASADPRVRGHRHDQTVAGVLAHRLGMKLTPHGIQSYSSTQRRIRAQTMIAVDRSVHRSDVPLRSFAQVRRDRYVGAAVQWVATARKRWA